MQNNRFVVLTGHLSNYPLSELVGILRHQKKSGRLLIEYAKGPATLFFENGELIDVHLNELAGLQAICVLLSQPDASFNFNPLIRSSQRSIDQSMQRVVSELFGCWDETAVQIDAASSIRPLELQSDPAPREAPALQAGVERLALPPAKGISRRHKSIYVVAAALVIVIAISTVIALTANLKSRDGDSEAVANTVAPVENTSANKSNEVSNRGSASSRSRSLAAEQRRESRSSSKRAANVQGQAQASTTESTDNAEAKSQSIRVVMQIENGRVLNASIANHAAGMDNFEALALRIARQRRYAPGKNGNETVTISVR